MSKRLSDEQLERNTREFRQKIGIEYVKYLDPMTVIVKLKRLFSDFDYLRVEIDEMQNALAQFDADNRLLKIREDTFRSMQSSDGRARFTVFHEIQHFALNHAGIRNRSIEKTFAENFHLSVKADEREANRATSVFMAPKYLVDPTMDARDIACQFGMSLTSAKIRRDEINRLDRIERGELRELPESVRKYLEEAQAKGYQPKTKLI